MAVHRLQLHIVPRETHGPKYFGESSLHLGMNTKKHLHEETKLERRTIAMNSSNLSGMPAFCALSHHISLLNQGRTTALARGHPRLLRYRR